MPPRQVNPQQYPPPMWAYQGGPGGPYAMPPQGYPQPYYPAMYHPGMMPGGMPPGMHPAMAGMPMAPPAVPPAPVGKQRRKRKKQPEGGPKKPGTSFVLYSNTVRDQVKQENPELSFIDIGRKLGEMWRAMEPHARKEYEEQATAAMKRYLDEKKQWLAQRAAQGQGMYNQD
eukprot:CAMPEP_0184288994 /NCGR_PEP_ID=MMETSP1049-20130417/1489_1 /TAXON_ID=77928 /ORGANISM="Proteomonas sulcata, Strain CCMP704" /LENGTH=171 /DNA_ID=CAMNT_0026595631 /DNA_START=182 /DNA_END=697 /DNA_ORIENTATION=-